MNCRHCNAAIQKKFLDLGYAPASNSYRSEKELRTPELTIPLRLFFCGDCGLVQTEDYLRSEELFDAEYAYFSSTSKLWLKHAKEFADMIVTELKLDKTNYVVELASNDGYLLKNFVRKGIPCLGIEPTSSTADAASAIGVPVLKEFFGFDLACRLQASGVEADLIIGNNVYAHVPDINDFTRGMQKLLSPKGTITLEFPHLLNLIEDCLFDTVYHEHYSYLSLSVVCRIFSKSDLKVWKVEQLETHGGSLRIYGCHTSDHRPIESSVKDLLLTEKNKGLDSLERYDGFQTRAEKIKFNLLRFLLSLKDTGEKIVAYGAAAKGNTLLNFAGVKTDLLPVIFDAAPSKQGMFAPGSQIPILPPEQMTDYEFDYLLILPWNIHKEIIREYQYLSERGVRFVIAVPDLVIL